MIENDRDVIRIRLMPLDPEPEAQSRDDRDNLNPAQRATAEAPMNRPAPSALTPSERAAQAPIWHSVRQALRRKTTANAKVEYSKITAEELRKSAPAGASTQSTSRLGTVGTMAANYLAANSGGAGAAISGTGSAIAGTMRAGAALAGPAAMGMTASMLAAVAPIGFGLLAFTGGAEFVSNELSGFAATAGINGENSRYLSDSARWFLAQFEKWGVGDKSGRESVDEYWQKSARVGGRNTGHFSMAGRDGLSRFFSDMVENDKRLRGVFKDEAAEEIHKRIHKWFNFGF